MRLTCADAIGDTAFDMACIGNAKVEARANVSNDCRSSKHHHHGEQGRRYLEVHLKSL